MPSTAALTTTLLVLIAVLVSLCAGLVNALIVAHQSRSPAKAFQQAACTFGFTLTLCFMVLSATAALPGP
ncbi:hypothetical protein [Streptomyces sp. NPDC055056]